MFSVIWFILGLVIGIYLYENPEVLAYAGNYLVEISDYISK